LLLVNRLTVHISTVNVNGALYFSQDGVVKKLLFVVVATHEKCITCYDLTYS